MIRKKVSHCQIAGKTLTGAQGSSRYSQIAIIVVQFVVVLMYGCMVPVPTPRKIKGPDLNAIQLGSTTRDAFGQMLGRQNSNRIDAPDGRFFRARWEEDGRVRWIGIPNIDDQSSKIVNVFRPV